MSVLAVIPARGGSRGLPGKNLLDVGGKPLIAWTIEAAQGSRLIDRTVFSSDDADIIRAATALGCEAPFVRPAEFATDDIPVYDALFHAADQLNDTYDILVLLQPTSPLRTSADIDGCIEQLYESGAPACVSVSEPGKSPYWSFSLGPDMLLEPLFERSCTTRRQDLPDAYILNGAVYAAKFPWLREGRTFLTDKTRGYLMPPERSLDVDTELDLTLVRALLDQDPTEGSA